MICKCGLEMIDGVCPVKGKVAIELIEMTTIKVPDGTTRVEVIDAALWHARHDDEKVALLREFAETIAAWPFDNRKDCVAEAKDLAREVLFAFTDEPRGEKDE